LANNNLLNAGLAVNLYGFANILYVAGLFESDDVSCVVVTGFLPMPLHDKKKGLFVIYRGVGA